MAVARLPELARRSTSMRRWPRGRPCSRWSSTARSRTPTASTCTPGTCSAGRARTAARSSPSYLRVIDPGRKFAEPSIGRVLTTPAFRGTGLGRAVMIEGLARAARAHPGHAVRIAAQQRLEAFYASLGFRTVSPPFEEDGIPHVEMLWVGPSPERTA